MTTNAGAQAGHTSVHRGVKRVVYHLPTVPLVAQNPGTTIYLNAGSIIDVDVLFREINDNSIYSNLYIHPNAAIITDECKEAEMQPDNTVTSIASTRKGVGEALARKIMRRGKLARHCSELFQYVRRLDLNARLNAGAAILVEVPQGLSLSVNGPFYPHCTSRDCTIMQGLNDAGIHPRFYGETTLVLRTFPIRVGNIVDTDGRTIGESGGCYPDQEETTWEALGVEAEITTVTKRVRRVFTWSQRQAIDAMIACRPDHVYLSFCDYLPNSSMLEQLVHKIQEAARHVGLPPPSITYSTGSSTDDVHDWPMNPPEDHHD